MLDQSGIVLRAASRQAEAIKALIKDLERAIQILDVDICTEERRVGILNKADRLYPVLARTLGARRENLRSTIAALERRRSSLVSNEGFASAA